MDKSILYSGHNSNNNINSNNNKTIIFVFVHLIPLPRQKKDQRVSQVKLQPGKCLNLLILWQPLY